jgi:hypothetical protein
MANDSCYECGARVHAGALTCAVCGAATKPVSSLRRLLVICVSIFVGHDQRSPDGSPGSESDRRE